jgi:hypothetical protein
MIFSLKRKTKLENRYHPKMGRLKCRVTRVYKTIFGIPYKQIHAYRETYYGKVKELDECKLWK